MKVYAVDNINRYRTYVFIGSLCTVVYMVIFYYAGSYITIADPMINSIISVLPIVTVFGCTNIIINIFYKLIMKLCRIPDISGKYSGYLHSSIDGGHERVTDANMLIKQNFMEIDICLSTKYSESHNEIAHMERINDGCCKITYIYRNDGNNIEELNSHSGTCIISINMETGKLCGEYYNKDRKTRGRLELERD